MRPSQSMPASLVENCTASNNHEVTLALRRIGVSMIDSYYEQAEELCQNVLVLLYTLMWKGLNGSPKSWKVCGNRKLSICSFYLQIYYIPLSVLFLICFIEVEEYFVFDLFL